MQGYLSISDFARLRKVNPKSLRYYERIGALVPAYTDPKTGYRYYALEQLVEMDLILMCLEMDIPLRDAKKYRKPDQTLDIQHLLQDGQQRAREKLAHLQDTMQQMEEALRRMEENQCHQPQSGVYRRHLGQRVILREPFTPHSGGELVLKERSTNLFLRGQSLGLLPAFLFPIGLIAKRQSGTIETDLFLEVLQQKTGLADLDTLPEGDYLCQQKPAQAMADVDNLILEYFIQHPEAEQVIITHPTTPCFDLKGPPLELQEKR